MTKMTKFEKNKIVLGYVTGVEKYGIFVNLDEYYSGLIHISEISSGFVKDIEKYANVGESIKVRILDVDDKKKHVKLSVKNMNYRFNNIAYIKETPSVFSTLKNNLQIWIEKKLKEYNS